MTKAKFTSDAYWPEALTRDLERSVAGSDAAVPSDETLESVHEQLDILLGNYTVMEESC